MSRQMIPCLIKFFSIEAHADQFIAGDLFMNRLSRFKKLEGRDDGRSDANEAIAMWWQPHDIIVTLSVPGIGDTTITKDDLAAPVSTSFDFHDHLHIFCMSAVVVPERAVIQPTFECNEDEAAELKRSLTIDDRCFQFGEHAVIVSTVPFLDKVKAAALSRQYALTAKLVKYYDERLFHGSFKREDIPFSKQKRFEYQKEFRLCINNGTRGTAPLTLNIGSIRDISLKLRSRQLNERLRPVSAA